MPSTRIMLALVLMASTAAANAECVASAAAINPRSACLHDISLPASHSNRPAGEVRTSNDVRASSDAHINDNRWEAARVLGAASVASQGGTERDSTVARSINELPWADSHDWIRNPPEWVRDIKDSRARRAPVPLLHLWRSQERQTLVALGVSHSGKPGVFIARKLPY